MPKMKSHRGAAKTFRRTATGKLKRHRAFRSHILTSKSRKRKRHLRKATSVSKADARRINILMQI